MRTGNGYSGIHSNGSVPEQRLEVAEGSARRNIAVAPLTEAPRRACSTLAASQRYCPRHRNARNIQCRSIEIQDYTAGQFREEPVKPSPPRPRRADAPIKEHRRHRAGASAPWLQNGPGLPPAGAKTLRSHWYPKQQQSEYHVPLCQRSSKSARTMPDTQKCNRHCG